MTLLARVLLLAAALAICTGLPLDASGGALPFRLELQVDAGSGAAPESVRRDLELELLAELDEAGCFRSVERFEPDRAGGELLFRVIIDEVRRQTTYDMSLSERYAPDAPPDHAGGLTATVEARIVLEVLTLPDRLRLRQKRFSVSHRHSPRAGEDARVAVRFEMISEVVRNSRVWVCRGSARKLARRIETARRSAEPR